MKVDLRAGSELGPAAMLAIRRFAATATSAPFGDEQVWDAWRHTVPSDRIITTLTATDGGETVGVLALSARRNQGGDHPAFWQLWGETVDFGTIWAEPSRAGDCWSAWFRTLRSAGVDCVRLRNVRMSDPVVTEALATAKAHGVRLALVDRRLAPYVDLRQGFDHWLTTRSKSQRRQYRRAQRAFGEIPGLAVHLTSDVDGVTAAVETFFDLHAERRRSLGLTSVYDDAQVVNFLETIAEPWTRAGRLRALIASSHGEPVALELLITTETTWFSMNGGWRESFAHHHAGTGILLHAMRLAYEAGAGRYSLLEGEEPYKMRMASGRHQLATWDLHLSEAS